MDDLVNINGNLVSKETADYIMKKKKERLRNWKSGCCKECGFKIKYKCYWCGDEIGKWKDDVCNQCDGIILCNRRSCWKDSM